jgi:hypothetical protein
MAIAFVAAADLGNNGGATNSLTAAYTVGSGANRLLVVGFVGDYTTLSGGGGFDDITGVTYAGAAMTLAVKLVDNSSANASRYTYLYFLVNPASGSNNVVISCTNVHFLLAVAADYTGAAQSGQPQATTSNFNDASPISLTTSITTVAGCVAVLLATDGIGSNAAHQTAGAGATYLVSGVQYTFPVLFDSGGPIAASGAYSMTTNDGNTPASITHIIASFSPPSAVVAGTSHGVGFLVSINRMMNRG